MSAALDALIPHRAPMQWIDALTDCSGTTATATACFRAGHFAVDKGAALETALVECVAQTAAAALGQRARAAGRVGAADKGMLGAVSRFEIRSRPPLDKTLTIAIRELRRLGPMLLISSTVSCEGQVIAAGELSLYA